ncbi:MAG: DNA mismatch repair protein, partial [Chitinophagaceae bacterium]|nr:DNA mismatch repair protein [Chitinophagaceae bacterium]
MYFETDNQTLEDLDIFNGRGGHSIYSIFNKTATRGGASILEEMFRYPLATIEDINNRVQIIRFFTTADIPFPLEQGSIDIVEHYLGNTDERSKLPTQPITITKKIAGFVVTDNEYQAIHKGVVCLIELLRRLHEFVTTIRDKVIDNPYARDLESIDKILSTEGFSVMIKENNKTKLSYAAVAEYDRSLRFTHRGMIIRLLKYLYYLDVYMTVAKVAVAKGFIFPTALEKGQHAIHLKGLYHPQLTNPVANDISIYAEKNIIFLTGANMAGKSTFMKSLGIA